MTRLPTRRLGQRARSRRRRHRSTRHFTVARRRVSNVPACWSPIPTQPLSRSSALPTCPRRNNGSRGRRRARRGDVARFPNPGRHSTRRARQRQEGRPGRAHPKSIRTEDGVRPGEARASAAYDEARRAARHQRRELEVEAVSSFTSSATSATSWTHSRYRVRIAAQTLQWLRRGHPNEDSRYVPLVGTRSHHPVTRLRQELAPQCAPSRATGDHVDSWAGRKVGEDRASQGSGGPWPGRSAFALRLGERSGNQAGTSR